MLFVLLLITTVYANQNNIMNSCIKEQAPCIFYNYAGNTGDCQTCLDISSNCIWIDKLKMLNVSGSICPSGLPCYNDSETLRNVNGFCSNGALLFPNTDVNIECKNLSILGVKYEMDIHFNADVQDYGHWYWETCKVSARDMSLGIGLLCMFIVLQCCTCFLCWVGIPCVVCPRRTRVRIVDEYQTFP